MHERGGTGVYPAARALGSRVLAEGEEGLPGVGAELVAPGREVGDAEDGALGKLEGGPGKGSETVQPMRARGEKGATAVAPRSLRR